jgi:hypothetical protein
MNRVQTLTGGAPAANYLAGGMDEMVVHAHQNDCHSILDDCIKKKVS